MPAQYDVSCKRGSVSTFPSCSTALVPAVARLIKKSYADSQLLTSDHTQWKGSLKSGLWGLPDEEIFELGKECKVKLVDNEATGHLMSLQVAVQPPKDSQQQAALDTLSQLSTTARPTVDSMPKITSTEVTALHMSQLANFANRPLARLVPTCRRPMLKK